MCVWNMKFPSAKLQKATSGSLAGPSLSDSTAPAMLLWETHLISCTSFCFLGYFIVIAKWIGQQFWAFNTFHFKSLPILCPQCSNALESFSDLQEPESLFYDYWCSIVRSCVLVSCSSLHIAQFLSDSQLQRKFYFVWEKKNHWHKNK